MPTSPKLWILAALALCVLGLAIATGHAKPGTRRRALARLGATCFFAFLVAFFWLAPEFAQFVKHLRGKEAELGERSGFLTGMAVFFSIGGLLSVWKLVTTLRGGGSSGSESATH